MRDSYVHIHYNTFEDFWMQNIIAVAWHGYALLLRIFINFVTTALTR